MVTNLPDPREPLIKVLTDLEKFRAEAQRNLINIVPGPMQAGIDKIDKILYFAEADIRHIIASLPHP